MVACRDDLKKLLLRSASLNRERIMDRLISLPAFMMMIINQWKGLNYHCMNIFERGLCVLQCGLSLTNYILWQFKT